MPHIIALGVDPGVTTGLARWEPHENFPLEHTVPELAQTTPDTARLLVETWLRQRPVGAHVLVAIEAFMLGNRSVRNGDPNAARITQELIADIKTLVDDADHPFTLVSLHRQSAAHVKPWATNARLDAAGLLKPSTPYPRHARDALRHALYAACKNAGVRDPHGRWGPVR